MARVASFDPFYPVQARICPSSTLIAPLHAANTARNMKTAAAALILYLGLGCAAGLPVEKLMSRARRLSTDDDNDLAFSNQCSNEIQAFLDCPTAAGTTLGDDDYWAADDDDDDGDDDLINQCANEANALHACPTAAGTTLGDDDYWTADDDDFNPTSCAEVQTLLTGLCGEGPAVCQAEYHTYMECMYEQFVKSFSGASCELTCASSTRTPAPTPADFRDRRRRCRRRARGRLLHPRLRHELFLLSRVRHPGGGREDLLPMAEARAVLAPADRRGQDRFRLRVLRQQGEVRRPKRALVRRLPTGPRGLRPLRQCGQDDRFRVRVGTGPPRHSTRGRGGGALRSRRQFASAHLPPSSSSRPPSESRPDMLPRPSSKAFKFSQPRRGDGVRPGQGYHRRRQRGVVPFEVGFGASGRAVTRGFGKSPQAYMCV